VKGDLAGLCFAGGADERVTARAKTLSLLNNGATFEGRAVPVLFWDVFGKNGHALRTTVSEMGPLLLARLLDLNEVQEGVLAIAFRVADEQGLLLLDLKDLRAMIAWVGENAPELSVKYGNVAPASVGAIQRGLLLLEQAGAESFFGEPPLELSDLMQRDFSGFGVVSVLDATTLINNPRVYTTMLLWLLSELFEELPEVGDLDKPKLVFFFDEAHLLFNNASKALLERIEQVVRLVRSKGVGIYFVTQSPLDIPDSVAGQLGNRVQHALRAFTPSDQKAVKAAGDTFRANPHFSAAAVLPNLEVGEALVSCLDAKGAPQPVERVLIGPPRSRLGPISSAERQEIIERSPVAKRYGQIVDRGSAYELLTKRKSKSGSEGNAKGSAGSIFDALLGGFTGSRAPSRATKGGKTTNPVESFVASTARMFGTEIKRQIVRGIMGSMRR